MPNRVFLERTSYRMRRMLDAVRLLPILALGLWMVPLMWSLPAEVQDGEPMKMSRALEYVFGIWILMVLCCWALWRHTKGAVNRTQQDEGA